MYTSTDYRRVILSYVEKAGKSKGYKLRMAEAMNCHSSFVSQVLTGTAHITPDHAAGLCDLWGLSEEESKYFINLVNIARSSSRRYKLLLEKEQEELRRKQKDLSARLKSREEILDTSRLSAWYYSSWKNVAIHILLSLAAFQTTESISKRLSIPYNVVKKTLDMLERFKVIKKDGETWKIIAADIHLNAESPHIGQHHSNWRQYALARMGFSHAEETHYTGVMTLSRTDFEKIRDMALRFITESREIAKASPEEDLFCLNLDAFKI